MSIVSIVIAWTIGATAVGVFRGLGWLPVTDDAQLPASMQGEGSS